MQLDFIDVLTTVFSLVVLVLPGFILVKTKVLSAKADAYVSDIILYGSQPFLLFMSFQKREFTSEIAINMLVIAGLSVAVHAVMIGLMYLIFRNKDNNPTINIMRFASVFGNVGFMGLPFLQTLFSGQPEVQGEILIYGATVIAVFNIINWTIGVFMVTGDRKSMSLKKVILNPNIIAIVLGLILFLTVKQPLAGIAEANSAAGKFLSKLMQSFDFMGNMVTPLAMTLIGIKLAGIGVKKLFMDKWAYTACFNKLILASVIATLSVAFLPVADVIKYALFFIMSMPSAANAVMFAVRFGGDSDGGTVMVLLSTVLSIVTIPLMFLLFSAICG